MITDVALLIRELGMSQSDFAKELGIPEGQVSRLVAGEEQPDLLMTLALKGYRSEKLALDKPATRLGLTPLPVSARSFARDPNFVGDSWTANTARLSLQILINIAAMKQLITITYGDLHRKVVTAGGKDNIGTMTKYAQPLGRIAAYLDSKNLPVLTAIVVSKSSGLPSSGIDEFVSRHLDLNHERTDALHFDLRFRREVFDKIWLQIFEYPNWPQVLQQLGLSDLQ
jgi:transcriptional regulator with XRE-family HTH domain